MKSNLYRIREGRTDQWKGWCHELSTIYRNEAIETLTEENVLQELFLFFHLSGRDYVVSFIDGDALPSTDDRKINREHKKNFLECLERVTKIEMLYHIKTE